MYSNILVPISTMHLLLLAAPFLSPTTIRLSFCCTFLLLTLTDSGFVIWLKKRLFAVWRTERPLFDTESPFLAPIRGNNESWVRKKSKRLPHSKIADPQSVTKPQPHRNLRVEQYVMTGRCRFRTLNTREQADVGQPPPLFGRSAYALCMRFVTFIYLKGLSNYRIIKDSCLFPLCD